MMHIFKKNVRPEELARAKVIGLILVTTGENNQHPIQGPIHKVTLDMKGVVKYQEKRPEQDEAHMTLPPATKDEAYLTFPPMFKNINDIAKWSCNLLEDCHGCGVMIEQRVCVLELYTYDEISAASSKEMLKKIENNLKERMSGYTDSRQPTNDEVRIAWLVTEIDRLNEIIKAQCLVIHRTCGLSETRPKATTIPVSALERL